MTEGIYDITTRNKQTDEEDTLLTVLNALANMKLSDN
jgi:hypothetical protein